MAAPSSVSGIETIRTFFANYLPHSLPHITTRAVEAKNMVPYSTIQAPHQITRNELLYKLLITVGGIAVSFTVTFIGVKYLMDAMDPTKREKKEAHQRAVQLMRKIGVSGVDLTDYELCIASNLVDPLSMVTSWNDIGGLEDCIAEIQESVILPFRKQELFAQSSLLQPPKGVLLYGPPGCGKTMIAKATAKAAGARFINLQVSSLVDKWYGESQKRAEAVFSLAVKLQPTIIFIDEIDSFLRSRASHDHEATAMIKTQFMSFWDGLMTSGKTRVIIMGATNRPRDVDAAILRRMPAMFQIGLPKVEQRQSILELMLRNENLSDDVDIPEIARSTEGLSGSDLKELCRNAAIYRVRDYLVEERDRKEREQQAAVAAAGDGQQDFVLAQEQVEEEPGLRAINGHDFSRSLNKMKQNKSINNIANMIETIDCD